MYASFMSEQPCPACQGARLRPESLAVTVGALSIKSVCELNIKEAHDWVLGLTEAQERAPAGSTKNQEPRTGTHRVNQESSNNGHAVNGQYESTTSSAD